VLINIKPLAETASLQFGDSLRDDPSAWRDLDDLTVRDVVDICDAEAHSNAMSAMSQVLGAASENIVTQLELAVVEDGALADLDAELEKHVTGFYPAPYLGEFTNAVTWDEKLDALRNAFIRAVESYYVPPLLTSAVLTYMNSDKRFDGRGALKKGMAAFVRDNPAPDDWNEDARSGEEVSWGEDPTPKSKRTRSSNKRGPAAFKPSLVPRFPTMLRAAGVTKADIARMAGFSDSYIGYMFAGKKPWPGLTPEQRDNIQDELTARRDAMDEALEILNGRDLLLPGDEA
jgi:hypothetical protein